MSLLTTTSNLSTLAGRSIGLIELNPTGHEIAAALEAKHGSKPSITYFTVDEVEAQQAAIIKTDKTDNMKVLPATLHIKIAKGEPGVGKDVYEVPGYKKKTIFDLIK